jgi:hypothetical protein
MASTGFASDDMLLTILRQWRKYGTVTIKLEACDRKYEVPGALLCNASPYFVSALEGSFSEATSRTLTLPGCEGGAFKVFLFWLTHQVLPEAE